MPSFDILLPYYGAPNLMRDAVESVRAQTQPGWHMHVLDDAYPDQQIADWLSTVDDDRISFERSTTNLGVNGAFQALLQRSSADYVVFMGCDDRMLPRYIGRACELVAVYPDAALIQPGVRVIDTRGQPTTGAADLVKSWLRRRFPNGPTLVGGQRLAASLLIGNWTYFPSIAWKRSMIAERGFRSTYNVVLDLDLLLDIIWANGQMVLDSEIVFEYRRHSNSVSSKQAANGRRFAEEQDFYRDAAGRCRALGWRLPELAARTHVSSRLHGWYARSPEVEKYLPPGASRASGAEGNTHPDP